MDFKTSSPPLISIITIAYNSASTISDTLESVRIQDYPRIEHIIIDGGSKDDTVKISKQFPHVEKIISEPDHGLYDAMNKGISHSTGEIVGILNSDDFYVNSTVISDVVKLMEEQQSEALYADLVFVARYHTDQVVRYWKTGDYKTNSFLLGWMPPHPTFFVRREVYKMYGVYKTELRFSADYELMLRLLYKNRIKVSYLPKVIVKMREGGVSNASILNRIKANQEDRKAWRLNGLQPWLFTLWLKPFRKINQFISYKTR